MGSFVIAFLISIFLCGFGCERVAPASSGAGPVMSDGESMLFGGNECRVDADCASDVCAGTVCVGFLTVPGESARESIGKRFQAASAAGGDASRAEMANLTGAVATIVADTGTDPFMRSRAADFMRFMACGDAERVLSPYVKDSEEPVRFYSARVLARCGDKDASAVLKTFLNHDSEAVRTMAEAALQQQ